MRAHRDGPHRVARARQKVRRGDADARRLQAARRTLVDDAQLESCSETGAGIATTSAEGDWLPETRGVVVPPFAVVDDATSWERYERARRVYKQDLEIAALEQHAGLPVSEPPIAPNVPRPW